MGKRIYAAILVCCLILGLFPAMSARAAENGISAAIDNALHERLDAYFKTLLTTGTADHDDEELERWLSADVLKSAILRVERLSEQEKSVGNVAYTVTSYDEASNELSADVTENIDGQPFRTAHKVKLSGNADDGWRIESDNYRDAVLYEFISVNAGASAPGAPQSYPNTWNNTGDQATDIAQIALTQWNYAEAGDNHTKYNVWFYGSNQSAAWCAIFISWCANQAEIPTSIVKRNERASGFSVSNMNRNRYGAPAYAFGEKATKCGDIAYIDNTGNGVSNHVGLVYAADSDYIYTVEGNCGDKVIKRQFSAKTGRLGSSKTNIVFFARPNYAKSDVESIEIRERFDFNAEIGFSKPIDVYRTPANPAPYGQYSQSSCLCDRGAQLSDDSIWLAMREEYGGGWFRLQDALNISPLILASPESLTIKPGETKTISVRYSYTPDARRLSISSPQNEDIITVSESVAPALSNDGYGVATAELTVNGNRTGTAAVDFRLMDTTGAPRCETLYLVIVSETLMPPDILRGEYYYNAVRWAVENDIIIYPSQSFRPDEACNRASAVTFLWRLAGAPTPASRRNPFSDIVPEDGYYNAVLWAVERGITNGTTDTTFSPAAFCNRGQIVTFLHRFANTPPASGVNSFKDVAPDRFCYDSVNWASAVGVTRGFGDNTFRPAEICTRAQIITFLNRYAAAR